MRVCVCVGVCVCVCVCARARCGTPPCGWVRVVSGLGVFGVHLQITGQKACAHTPFSPASATGNQAACHPTRLLYDQSLLRHQDFIQHITNIIICGRRPWAPGIGRWVVVHTDKNGMKSVLFPLPNQLQSRSPSQ